MYNSPSINWQKDSAIEAFEERRDLISVPVKTIPASNSSRISYSNLALLLNIFTVFSIFILSCCIRINAERMHFFGQSVRRLIAVRLFLMKYIKNIRIFKNLTITLLRNTQILFVFLRQIYKTIC